MEEDFSTLKSTGLKACISQNAQSYIANHGYWLKNKIKTKAPSEVAFWDDCREKNAFSHILEAKSGFERDCQKLRDELRGFLLSNERFAFVGNPLCLKSFVKEEL